jgi:hypothetical protein
MNRRDEPLFGCCRGERQNRNVARSLNRGHHLSLVLCAVSGNPSGDDLPSFRNEISENPRIFVIDVDFFIGAESTDLAP